MNPVQGHIDQPRSTDIHRAHRVPVSGWVYLGEGRQNRLVAVHVGCSGTGSLAHTHLFFRRADVEVHLDLVSPELVGFELHAALPDGMCPEGGEVELHLTLELRGESALIPWQTTSVKIRADDLHLRPHGHVLRPSARNVLHRDDVYLMGPSSRAINGEVLALISRYLTPGGRVLDVGCGVGPFGPPLIEQGFDWLGIEVKDEDCQEMARGGLPHQKIVPDEPLPFSDASFDGGICLEVLEHIKFPDPFLAEISRVVQGRTIFSVPNFELTPLLGLHHIAPRHIFEPDHKNFFDRFSLAQLLLRHFRSVEVIDYAPITLGHSLSEILPYHLLAVADNAA